MEGFDCYGPQPLAKYEEFKRNGFSFVCRYYANAGSPKLLTRQDAVNISKAGLQAVAVYETNPTNISYFTTEKGKSDLNEAVKSAIEIGQPEDTAIYFAVDFDAAPNDFPAIGDYFRGILDQMNLLTSTHVPKHHFKIGVYGSFGVVDFISKNIKGVDYIWQTYAWSRAKVVLNYNIYQYKNNINFFGVNIDRDRSNPRRSSDIGGFTVHY